MTTESAGPAWPGQVGYLQLLGIQVLSPPEDIALGDPLTAQLVNLNHPAEGDESDQSGGRQQGKGHLQRLLEGLEVLILHTGVHHIQEDQWHLGTPLEMYSISGYTGEIPCLSTPTCLSYLDHVLDGGELRQQLSRLVHFRDSSIRWRKLKHDKLSSCARHEMKCYAESKLYTSSQGAEQQSEYSRIQVGTLWKSKFHI